jgi:epoxyqueuosine reductase QueG
VAVLSDELRTLLYDNGATLVGFADLASIVEHNMTSGVSVAINIPIEVIKAINDGPTMDYYNEYYRINEKLNQLVTMAARFLTGKGYEAYAQTTDVVKEFDVYRTALPHKTVATNAGLGWIGKSALFVTEQFGPAVRLSSLVTNAKLEYGIPVTTSKCGSCMECTDACPANAISGKLWNVKTDRDAFYNPVACRKKARELAATKINKEITLCGKCIEVCPYTRKYLSSDSNIN